VRRFLGLFVNPIEVQAEGLNAVFANLERVGVSAIATNTRVGQPADSGERFPDLHIDGYARVLDRLLWGQRELRVTKYPAFPSDPTLYHGLSYRPPQHQRFSGVDYDIPLKILAEAKRRGWQAHLQFHPLIPPGLRPEDQPVRIDGAVPQPPQVAMSGCPNNPVVQAYALALLNDLLRSVDFLDGIFLDWAEWPAYQLADHFTCFCPHCQAKARAQGYDWARITQDVRSLWDTLHSLDTAQLGTIHHLLGNPSRLLELLAHYPGWLDLLRFKAASITALYRLMRARLDQLGKDAVQLSARGWAPPWNRSSGMDYRALADICAAITPKLFLFDYAALPRWYGQALLEWNPQLSESAVLDTLVAVLNLPDAIQRRRLTHYHMGGPNVPHHVDLRAYRERVNEIYDQVAGKANLYPYLHAYLPAQQWRKFLELMLDSPMQGAWIHMYGYLSDEKLEILRTLWR
jgi:hypothetical protein